MSYQIEADVCSSMGNIRKNNEDNYYLHGLFMDEAQRDLGARQHCVSSDETQIYAVCDGMGGEEAGEDASLAAVRWLKKYERTKEANDPENIKRGLQEASDQIEKAAREKSARSGTTIAMLLIHQDTIRTVHLGDSRIYLWEEGQLRQITSDHSEVQYMYEMGLIKKESMDTYPRRHVITKYLGASHEDGLLSPSISDAEPLRPGAWYLICSDGLTDMVKDAEIAYILSNSANPSQAAQALSQAALKNGGRDNVTVLCLAVQSDAVNDQDPLSVTADAPGAAVFHAADAARRPSPVKRGVILCFAGALLILGIAVFLFMKDIVF